MEFVKTFGLVKEVMDKPKRIECKWQSIVTPSRGERLVISPLEVLSKPGNLRGGYIAAMC